MISHKGPGLIKGIFGLRFSEKVQFPVLFVFYSHHKGKTKCDVKYVKCDAIFIMADGKKEQGYAIKRNNLPLGVLYDRKQGV